MRPGGGVHGLFNTTGVPGGPVCFRPLAKTTTELYRSRMLSLPGDTPLFACVMPQPSGSSSFEPPENASSLWL